MRACSRLDSGQREGARLLIERKGKVSELVGWKGGGGVEETDKGDIHCLNKLLPERTEAQRHPSATQRLTSNTRRRVERGKPLRAARMEIVMLNEVAESEKSAALIRGPSGNLHISCHFRNPSSTFVKERF